MGDPGPGLLEGSRARVEANMPARNHFLLDRCRRCAEIFDRVEDLIVSLISASSAAWSSACSAACGKSSSRSRSSISSVLPWRLVMVCSLATGVISTSPAPRPLAVNANLRIIGQPNLQNLPHIIVDREFWPPRRLPRLWPRPGGLSSSQLEERFFVWTSLLIGRTLWLSRDIVDPENSVHAQ